MKAIWKGDVIAESDDTIMIKDEHYFPAESIKVEYLKKNGKTGICEERGRFCNYNLQRKGEIEEDAAVVFNEPAEGAREISNFVVFNNEVVKLEE